MDLPFSRLLLPDDDIFADVKHGPIAPAEGVAADFVDRRSQQIDIGGLTVEGTDPHLQATLPKGLDRRAPADRGTVNG